MPGPDQRAGTTLDYLTTKGSFPHCDWRVLHAPDECEFCDDHPDWQAERVAKGYAFTGHSSSELLPCPADEARPPGGSADHRRWGGNTATSKRGDPTQPAQTFASVMLYGDQGGRVRWPLPERILRRARRPIENAGRRWRGWKVRDGWWSYSVGAPKPGLRTFVSSFRRDT
jgi:hypothetical protein